MKLSGSLPAEQAVVTMAYSGVSWHMENILRWETSDWSAVPYDMGSHTSWHALVVPVGKGAKYEAWAPTKRLALLEAVKLMKGAADV